MSMPSFASDPAGFAEALERRAEEMKAKAARVEREIAETSATAASRDRSVTLTVNGSGGLGSIEFGVKAKSLTQIQLAATVMETYAKASAEASARTRALLAELVGDGGEAMALFDAAAPPSPDTEPRSAW
ncbi:YbaB/EbfC family nucleoid-associated protein [Phytomonospora endophytica]|uniref:DNA-binding protein YbaB n=1 Tax=Phytomonospora endophytica TaxID=714109 RepID=A0A841FDN8_9ACTN|nr:YbaB/EbfC family nucleoid-associated protein [Phytomonospora endophytica]MBB6035391.1 DNA-binding protein YbaB [Phytomonospora endophytica]GIG63857.1 hypothetical protein Pen01_01520 [Phytomonospora endophytica]